MELNVVEIILIQLQCFGTPRNAARQRGESKQVQNRSIRRRQSETGIGVNLLRTVLLTFLTL